MSDPAPGPAPSIFTRIMRGEIPSHRVYEDAHVVAFLDVAPVSRGHTLVVPREQVASLHDLSPTAASALGQALPRVARAIMGATGCRAYNLLINSGAEAGQVVMHVHAHLIPKHADGSGLRHEWRATPLDANAGAELAAAIRAALASG
ncbi:MAG: HIT family protein [Phycisphaeraceae bacterium]|nr:HIT family protein [Phycisphaeraceae bacterium]